MENTVTQPQEGCKVDIDSLNRRLYGAQAPKHCERIWINPQDCTDALKGPFGLHARAQRRLSGIVPSIDWPSREGGLAVPVTDTAKYLYCYERWVTGMQWQHTEEYRRFRRRYERKLERSDPDPELRARALERKLAKRYGALEELYQEAKAEQRLRTRREISPSNFREEGGVLIHVAAGGRLLLGDGYHRFSIALILDINPIPAMIGFVHAEALDTLPELRMSGAK